jgi:hypothetical protein
MLNQRRFVLGVAACLCVAAPIASADITPTYVGAFKFLTKYVTNGGMAYDPEGNGGAGSLFLSDYYTKKIYEIDMPAPVNSTDPAALNTGNILNQFTTSIQPYGLELRSTDGRLYVSYGTSGSGTPQWVSLNKDGTGESAVQSFGQWNSIGYGLTEVPQDWADTYTGGVNLLTTSGDYGAGGCAVDPYNDPMALNWLYRYGSGANIMTGYVYGDAYQGIQFVDNGDEMNIIVCGKYQAGDARLLFFHVSDIETYITSGGARPQPYQDLDMQSLMLQGQNNLFGLAYARTTEGNFLYSFTSGWTQDTYVYVWDLGGQIVPEPMTASLLTLGIAVMRLRRRRMG